MEIILFITGLVLGAVVTFFVMKNIQQKQQAAVESAYSDIYEKMQLQFENL